MAPPGGRRPSRLVNYGSVDRRMSGMQGLRMATMEWFLRWKLAASCGRHSMMGSCRRWASQQTCHPDKVVRGRYQIRSQLRPILTDEARAAESTNRLHPSKDLSDTLPLGLADPIAQVARGTTVDRAAPSAGVLRHVWRDVPGTQIGDAALGVVTLVRTGRVRTKARSRACSMSCGTTSRSAVPVA